tara:strand:+ start:135 stop:986 length:852 start_codon:yes stop_codon:yes gene_type:complete
MPKKKTTASSLNKEKFLIIGAGNMGIAVIKSLFNHRISSKKVVVIEKNQSSELKKLKKLNKFEIKNSIDKINNLYQPTITLIAVKPNQLKTLNGLDKNNKLSNSMIVSVIAGKKIKDLSKVFKKTSGIVRAMTNTPVSVNMGTTIVYFEKKIKTKQKKPIFDFMSLLGLVSETKKEDLIDDFTAIFGSGPAYIYLFIDSLIEIAHKSGFKNSDSMVLQTFLGSMKLLLSGQKKPSELQKKVISKGGTTEAALSILASNKGLKSLLAKAVKKATRRSKELSKIA